MILGNYLQINKNDYNASIQDTIDKLAYPININTENLFSALNNNISLADNIYCAVNSVNVTVDTNGNPTTTTKYQIDQNVKVAGLMVMSATNVTNSQTYPTGAPFISYTPQSNYVLINNVTGLQANQQYTLMVVTFYQ